MDRVWNNFFIENGMPPLSDSSGRDSGISLLSSRLDQTNSTLSMDVPPRDFESGYSSDRFPDADAMDDHPQVDHPDDDIPLDQLLQDDQGADDLPQFQNPRERFQFWAQRGAFDQPEDAEEAEVIHEAPIHRDDPHFALQNPIVQALVLADLGHLVPQANIVLPMEVEEMNE